MMYPMLICIGLKTKNTEASPDHQVRAWDIIINIIQDLYQLRDASKSDVLMGGKTRYERSASVAQ